MTKVEKYNDEPASRAAMQEIIEGNMFLRASFASELKEALELLLVVPKASIEKLIEAVKKDKLDVPESLRSTPEKEKILLERAESGRAICMRMLQRIITLKKDYLDEAGDKWFVEEQPEHEECGPVLNRLPNPGVSC